MAREDLLETFLSEARAKLHEALEDSDFDDQTKAKVQTALEGAVGAVDTTRLQEVLDRGQQAAEEDAAEEIAKAEKADTEARATATAAAATTESADEEEEVDDDNDPSTPPRKVRRGSRR